MHTIENAKISKAFGAFIREGRHEKGLMQKEVAWQVDICRSYYTQIESGKKQVYLTEALNICNVLDLDICEFANQLK